MPGVQPPCLMNFLLALAAILVGLFCTATCMNAMRALSRTQLQELFHKDRWFHRLFRWLGGFIDVDGFIFTLLSTTLILRAAFVICSALFLVDLELVPASSQTELSHVSIAESAGLTVLLLLAYLFVGDFLPRAWAHSRPEKSLRASSTIAAPFLLLLLPLNLLMLHLARIFLGKQRLRLLFEAQTQNPERLLEAMEEVPGQPALEGQERKLLSSVMTFRGKVAREVMVPRIKMFSLDATMPIAQAAPLALAEGYSRIPLYQETLDHIVGVLLVKDLLPLLLQQDATALRTPVGSLAKSVLYTPETKRISQLLQEFRAKNLHMAIVVDEYGGTEGILTIEDILEELVGEIGDEYDIDEETLFAPQPGGAWLVDAQMGILDLEDKLGVKLPQSADYDTLGGFIFHKTGTIPPTGFRLHCDTVDLEIVSSNERCVEQVCIRPVDHLKA
jgi:putative hemolysin